MWHTKLPAYSCSSSGGYPPIVPCCPEPDPELLKSCSTDGLLRVPRGQYLRIQLKHHPPQTPKGSAAAAGSGSAASSSESDEGVPPIGMSKEEIKSLDSMDDPELMKHYVPVSTTSSLNT